MNDIPRSLDELVMSLISFEPGLRPANAFAVMQRLAAIAGLESGEAEGVSRAYLTTPALVGRDPLLASLRERMRRALSTGDRALMLLGPSGIGRSRLMDACVLEAKTLGARVLRANPRSKAQELEVAYALAQHLLEVYPSEQLAQQFPQLFQPAQAGVRPQLRPLAQLSAAPGLLERWFVPLMRGAAKAQPLVFAVDDAQRIDERSAALIAALIDRLRYGRASVLLSAEDDGQAPSQALQALSNRSESFMLDPLTEHDTKRLFASVFGDVPNLGPVATEIFALARGLPAASLSLAQHLIDRGAITYSGGAWTLPAVVSKRDLPQSAEDSVLARVAQLSPLARTLAQAHAVCLVEQLTVYDYRALAGAAETRAVDAALSELVAEQVLSGDGERYVVANQLWTSALERSLDPDTRVQTHRALAAMFRPRQLYAWIYHTFAADGGEEEAAALDALLASYEQSGLSDQAHVVDASHGKLASIYPRALAVAARLGRPARQLNDLRRGLLGTSIAAGEPAYYWMVADDWLDQLVHDSGLDRYRADDNGQSDRLTKALTGAFERYQAQSEAQRVYRPDEAIPKLVEYVAVSIAIGVRTMDYPLLRRLPELLEPFAPLSPLIAALWQNAVGCCESHVQCRYEAARARWISVLDTLKDVSGLEMRHVVAIRNAVQYAVAMVEAVFGLPEAARRVEGLDEDPYQRVSALYLRKIVRLEQGDWPGAEHLQRSAELLALRHRVPQMFIANLPIELAAHALARDVAGVKHVVERERAEAARYPGWIPYLRTAEAFFELVRGDLLKAKQGFELVVELTAPGKDLQSACMPMWMNANSGLCETLLALGRAADVRARASEALATCQTLKIELFASDLTRLLALAEAKLGDFASANARLDRLIEAQTAFGVTGMRIGISYEARAEIALWSDDPRAFEKYARLTAREYRHGAGCPLGTRYERLMREARSRGIRPAIGLTDFELTTATESRFATIDELRAAVRDALATTQDPAERYRHALRLVCSARAARGGHLYVTHAEELRLVATCDLSPPSARLLERARESLEDEQDRFETQTLAIEASESLATSATVHEDGIDYELLQLACVNQQGARAVGVIALAPGPHKLIHPLQPQLLATIAEHLARSSCCSERT